MGRSPLQNGTWLACGGRPGIACEYGNAGSQGVRHAWVAAGAAMTEIEVRSAVSGQREG